MPSVECKRKLFLTAVHYREICPTQRCGEDHTIRRSILHDYLSAILFLLVDPRHTHTG
jgi:hypothetical protein